MVKKLSIPKLRGKSSKSEHLPSRNALAQLAGGDKFDRSLGNYAKKTPLMGMGDRLSPSIFQMFPRRNSKF